MNMNLTITCAALACLAGTAIAGGQPSPILSVNPGFLDLDGTDGPGDGWDAFGAATRFADFFGDRNPGHGTIYGDNLENTGGIYQIGIPAQSGVEYEMSFRIQWETEWDARTRMGFEFFADDDATMISEEYVEIEEDADFAGFGYRRINFNAVAPEGTAFIRPVIRFDEVLSSGTSRAATIDNVIVREADDILNLNPGFEDIVGDGAPVDLWDSFGAANVFLDFLNNGNPGHGTLFGDMVGNSGGIYQNGIPAVPGESYTMRVDIAVEKNWDADLQIALEFFGEDDGFLISDVAEFVNPTPGAGYVTYELVAEAPDFFTAFVRPVVKFDNVQTSDVQMAAVVDNVYVQLTSTVGQGCPADLNGDEMLNFFDVSIFLSAFTGMDPVADFDQDGMFNFFDVSAFLSAYTDGCP